MAENEDVEIQAELVCCDPNGATERLSRRQVKSLKPQA